ncbi:MAG: ATP-binding protein [Solirubrobacterales bacterium]|nr:ATP-binding protein [Solirubrobacterales bacterium]
MIMRSTERQQSPDANALRLRMTALPENVMLVRQALDGAARELGASTAIVEDLKLAVTEACSNVVKYAYRESTGALEVTLDPADAGFSIVVRDDGTWLERAVSDGEAGGLGIPLMEAVTRRFEITSDANGTTVRLDFPLRRESAEPLDA